jgi:transcriptional regulator
MVVSCCGGALARPALLQECYRQWMGPSKLFADKLVVLYCLFLMKVAGGLTMYVPKHFAEQRLPALFEMIEQHPLGALVRVGDDGLDADHIPFELAPPTPEAPFGVLRAHVARANPLWNSDGAPVLVLFQGGSTYVTPNLYDKEAAGGRVVPTWNYLVVHARGRLRAIQNPAWILAQMARLTDRHEGPYGWAVEDAPAGYIDELVAATVGLEIVIEGIEGKWKASQNRSDGDRARVERETGLSAPG